MYNFLNVTNIRHFYIYEPSNNLPGQMKDVTKIKKLIPRTTHFLFRILNNLICVFFLRHTSQEKNVHSKNNVCDSLFFKESMNCFEGEF